MSHARMSVEEYSRLDGVAVAELVRKKGASPKEVAGLFVEAVEKVNPGINAVIEVWSDRLASLDGQAVPDGPFAGVPFLMKDVGAGEGGRVQESASRLMKGHVVDRDSFLTERFKGAGLVLLGRTTSPEFALGISTESVVNGATRNPWDLDRMVGGSSGGSAAAVAAGIVPVAHGSDNGGSIRIPASACGLVGLKPSRGRVTGGPDFGELFSGTLQEFVVSRTVRDTATMLDAVSAPAPGDPFVITQPSRPFREEVGAPMGRLRVAWTTNPWLPGATADPEVVGCVEQVASELRGAGLEVAEGSPAFDYEEFLRATCDAWAFGMYAGMDMFAAMTGREITTETVEPVTLSFYDYSKGLGPSSTFMAEMVLNKFRRTFGMFFEEHDLLITPTLTRLPEPIGSYSKMRTDIDFVGFMRLCDETRGFCTAANVTGQPAISLPLGESNSRLPIGVELFGKFGEEGTLLRVSSYLERTMPWRDRIPPIHASR